jgi:hypothetical protein
MLSFALAVFVAQGAQTPTAPSPTLPAQPAKATKAEAAAFELDVDLSARVVRRARAGNLTVADAGKRLAEVLKVPVHVTPGVARRRVTLPRMDDAPLSNLLFVLAPVVYLDWRETPGKEPELLAAHLMEEGLATPPPPPTPGVTMQGVVEDSVEEPGGNGGAGEPATTRSAAPARPDDAPFLEVRRTEGGRVSVDARDQGLGVILFEVAQAYRVRFDLRISEAPIVGRISLADVLPSELPGHLGQSGVGIDVRRNLATGEETPLRFFVDPVR